MLRGGFYMLGAIGVTFTDYLLPAVLLSAGIFLTIRLRGVQLRFLGFGLKNMLCREREENGGISPFRALATSLAAQLGTGNIVGAGTAIITGGPGAVFWMWVSAFFGMAIAYSEASLAVITRKKAPDGSFSGGAAHYIQEAFGGKGGRLLAGAFSFFATAALGFTGVAVQSNSIAAALKDAFGIPFFLTAVIITLLAGFFILKGTGAISGFAEKTVPLFATAFMLSCIAVIIVNIKNLPRAVGLIFSCAFSPTALLGGMSGISVREALTQGIKRGLFTNEAGMGSTPCMHALSSTKSAHLQGALGIAGVFIDTFLMLSITATAIITVFYTGNTHPDMGQSGSLAVTAALATVFTPRGAAVLVAFSVLFFAFASILGWSLSGRMSAIYLFGKKSEKLYIFSTLLFIFIGCLISQATAWALTDIFNTLMVLTNIPALLRLSAVTAAHIERKKGHL